MTLIRASKSCPPCGAQDPKADHRYRVGQPVLPAPSRAELKIDWRAGERFRQPLVYSSPDGLAVASEVLGKLSLIATVTGLACLLLGPFSCFVTWIFAYYVCLVGLPVHLLALGAGVAGLSQYTYPGKDRGSGFALGNGLLGTLLSGLVLAWMSDLFRGLPLVR
jgi:hypothetical protein